MASGSGIGSKPTMVPQGSQVQMAHPWSANQPAWGGVNNRPGYALSPSQMPQSTMPMDYGDGRTFPGQGNDNGDPIRREYLDKPNTPMPQTSFGQMGSGMPSWRRPMFPAGLLSAFMLPGMQTQQQSPQTSPTNPATGGTPAPTPPAPPAPTAPTQSAMSAAVGSSIDPGVMAGLSAADRANYQLDPASGTWISVR